MKLLEGRKQTLFVTVTKVLHSDRLSPPLSFVARVIIINIIWFYVKRFSLICYLVQIEIGINRIPINSIQKYNRQKSGNGGRKGRNAQKIENHSISDRKSLKRVIYGESLQGQQPGSQPASHIDDNKVYNNLFFSLSVSYVYGKSANSQFSQGVEWVHPPPLLPSYNVCSTYAFLFSHENCWTMTKLWRIEILLWNNHYFQLLQWGCQPGEEMTGKELEDTDITMFEIMIEKVFFVNLMSW